MAAAEAVPTSAVNVVHPLCGGVVLVVEIDAQDGQVDIQGICYRCDRYVRLVLTTRYGPSTGTGRAQGLTLAEIRQQAVTERYAQCRGNVAAMARSLGITREQIYRYMHKYGLVLRGKNAPRKEVDPCP